jgi:hypothetical protein
VIIDLTRFFTPRLDDCCPHCGAPGRVKINVTIAGEPIKEAVQPLRPRQTPDPAPDGEEDP